MNFFDPEHRQTASPLKQPHTSTGCEPALSAKESYSQLLLMLHMKGLQSSGPALRCVNVFFLPRRIQRLCQSTGVRDLCGHVPPVGADRQEDPLHQGAALLRLGARHHRHGHQQVEPSVSHFTV